MHTQKEKIARAQLVYKARKERERERERFAKSLEVEDAAFEMETGMGRLEVDPGGRDMAPDSPSVVSVKTSITVMRSEVSVSTPYRKEKGGL